MLNCIYLFVSMFIYFWLDNRASYNEYMREQEEHERRKSIRPRNGHKYLGTNLDGDDIFEGDIVEYDDVKFVNNQWEHHVVITTAEASNDSCIQAMHLLVQGA